MLEKKINSAFKLNSWLKILIIILITLGIFFRFVNLGKKPIWGDESHTFSVISGYSYPEVVENLANKGLTDVKSFLTYQYPNPNKTLSDVIQQLAVDVHPPIYFLMARQWVEWFGHSVAVLRSFSAATSVLALLCIYWLCLELFKSPVVGWIALLQLAVSPFHILYAQEARPYSLMTLAVLLSGASLLWAMRTQKKSAWLVYAICLVLGLYTQLFFLFVVFGYAAYVAIVEKFKFTNNIKNFIICNFISLISFFPWINVVLSNRTVFSEKSAWVSQQKLTILGAIRIWSENISLIFIDPRASSYFNLGKYGFFFLIPPFLLLACYSQYFLYKKTEIKSYLFIFILIFSTALPLILADLFLGGNRQIWPRYLVPCLLGFQISVAYLLADLSHKSFILKWQRQLFLFAVAAIFSAGVFFCSISSQADTWWNKYASDFTVEIAKIINQAKNPIILVKRDSPGFVFYFSLNPSVKILFLKNDKFVLPTSNSARDAFLLDPSSKLINDVKSQKLSLERVAQIKYTGAGEGKRTDLWKIN